MNSVMSAGCISGTKSGSQLPPPAPLRPCAVCRETFAQMELFMPDKQKCSRMSAAVMTSNSSKATHAVRFHFPRQKSNQVNEQQRVRVVWHRHKLIDTVARPIFLQHLFLCDQDDLTAQPFAFTNKVAAFEVGGQANDVEWSVVTFPSLC